MAHASSVYIGSYPDWPDADVTIDGSDETVTASKGGLYLTHETDTTLSLLEQFKAAMTSAGVTNPAFRILRNRKVELSADANFTVTWATAAVATYLGFDPTANLSGADAYVAPNVSPLLWSPGMTESPGTHPLGVNGRPVNDVISGTAPNGAVVSRIVGQLREYRYSYGSVLLERHADSSNSGGTYFRFFDEVISQRQRMFHYKDVVEDDDDASTAMVLTSGEGPMRSQKTGVSPGNERMAGLETVDSYFVHEIDALSAAEFA